VDRNASAPVCVFIVTVVECWDEKMKVRECDVADGEREVSERFRQTSQPTDRIEGRSERERGRAIKLVSLAYVSSRMSICVGVMGEGEQNRRGSRANLTNARARARTDGINVK
jgi:hypothetical protein